MGAIMGKIKPHKFFGFYGRLSNSYRVIILKVEVYGYITETIKKEKY